MRSVGLLGVNSGVKTARSSLKWRYFQRYYGKNLSSCANNYLVIGMKVLLIVAPHDFRDEELLEPRKILEDSGIHVTVASKGVSRATGMFGAEVDVDKDIADIDAGDYDAVVFVGGVGASVYFADNRALTIAKDACRQEKVVGAICIAPSVLANAGLLAGKKATSWPSEADNLRAKGATYTGRDVEQDGKVITGKGPHAAAQFGRAILNAIKG